MTFLKISPLRNLECSVRLLPLVYPFWHHHPLLRLHHRKSQRISSPLPFETRHSEPVYVRWNLCFFRPHNLQCTKKKTEMKIWWHDGTTSQLWCVFFFKEPSSCWSTGSASSSDELHSPESDLWLIILLEEAKSFRSFFSSSARCISTKLSNDLTLEDSEPG